MNSLLDPQHPLVPVSVPILQGNQHEDIVIPCKPTSKMWNIQLIKEGDEVNDITELCEKFPPNIQLCEIT